MEITQEMRDAARAARYGEVVDTYTWDSVAARVLDAIAGLPDQKLEIGTVIHGYCGGHFGRDSYACRRVEATGSDWIVTRDRHGQAEFVSGRVNLDGVLAQKDDTSYCHEGCTG